MFVAHFFVSFCPFERSAKPDKNIYTSHESLSSAYRVLRSNKSTGLRGGFFFTPQRKKKIQIAASPDGPKWKARSGIHRALHSPLIGWRPYHNPVVHDSRSVGFFNDMTMMNERGPGPIGMLPASQSGHASTLRQAKAQTLLLKPKNPAFKCSNLER